MYNFPLEKWGYLSSSLIQSVLWNSISYVPSFTPSYSLHLPKLWTFLVIFWAPQMSKPSASISPYYIFTLFSFLPSQNTQALLFSKANWLDITSDLKFLNSSFQWGKKEHSTGIKDMSYVSENLCSASKRIMIIGKWQCHLHLIVSGMVYFRQHFKETLVKIRWHSMASKELLQIFFLQFLFMLQVLLKLVLAY